MFNVAWSRPCCGCPGLRPVPGLIACVPSGWRAKSRGVTARRAAWGTPNIAARGLVADVTRVPPASRSRTALPVELRPLGEHADGALQRKGCQEAAGYVDLVTHTSTEASIGRTAGARIERVELRRMRLPLVSPFRTSFGTQTARDVLLRPRRSPPTARAGASASPMSEPLYSSEYVDGAQHVLRDHLLPGGCAAVDRGRRGAASRPAARRRSRATRWPRRRWRWRCSTPSCAPPGCRSPTTSARSRDRGARGVSVGIMDSIPELLDAVGGYLDAGLRADQAEDRARLGRRAGARRARALRRRRAAAGRRQHRVHALRDARHLARLDAFDLLLIEQPLPEEDVLGHAELARLMRTPICLDESIISARAAADAIALGACSIVNIKPGRVGGYLEARAHPRRVRRATAIAGVVRRHARDRHRPGRQRGAGRAARTSRCPATPRPRDRYYAHGHHRAVRAATTATWPCRPARASASSRCRTRSPRSPPRSRRW